MNTDLLTTAAQVSGMWSLAAFAIAALIGYLASRKGRVPAIAWAVVTLVALLGLVPIIGSLYVQLSAERALYVLRVNVTDKVGRPIQEAVVTNSLGNHADKKAGAWQFEIPTRTRPANGKVTIYASVPSAFAHGSVDVLLESDFFPAATVVVDADQNQTVRGTVQDVDGRAVSGARVSLDGYSDEAVVTDASGSFSLAAHAAEDQQVALRVEKNGYHPVMQWHPAGTFPATLILRHQAD